MSNPIPSVHTKVLQLFRGLVQDRAERLDGRRIAEPAMSTIAAALSDEYDPLMSDKIALHLADWNSDAAFIVALHLYPELFSADEIKEGIGLFLCHAPNHIREACRLTNTYVWENFPDDDTPNADF